MLDLAPYKNRDLGSCPTHMTRVRSWTGVGVGIRVGCTPGEVGVASNVMEWVGEGFWVGVTVLVVQAARISDALITNRAIFKDRLRTLGEN